MPTLLIGAATALPKLYQAGKQAWDASRLKFQDTTTPEQRELLQAARLEAAAGRAPGQSIQQGRLAQAQSAAMQAATVGSGSASDFIAANSAANGQRLQGELQLGTLAEQYQQRAKGQLNQQLMAQAQQRQRDLATYNNTKAALTQASGQNLANAVDGAASYAAYGIGQRAGAGPEGAVDELTAGPVAAALPGYAGPPDMLPNAAGRLPYGGGLRNSSYRPRFGGGRYAGTSLRYGYNN